MHIAQCWILKARTITQKLQSQRRKSFPELDVYKER